jgi:hypothetical protein
MNGKYGPKKILLAKLSFTDGFWERPVYLLKGKTTEKHVGVGMINLLKDNFNINDEDLKRAKLEEIEQIKKDILPPSNSNKILRDEKGRIISPFASKLKY